MGPTQEEFAKLKAVINAARLNFPPGNRISISTTGSDPRASVTIRAESLWEFIQKSERNA